MSESEVNSYYEEWEEFAVCSYDSDYVELFDESSMLITDCGSFLTEYFITGKPIVHLISGYSIAEPISEIRNIFNTFYKVETENDLFRVLRFLVDEKEDPLLQARLNLMRELSFINKNSSKLIVSDLLYTLSKNREKS